MRKRYEILDNNNTDKTVIEEKTLCSRTCHIRLPFAEELGDDSQFTRYYRRVGAVASDLCENEHRIRSLKSSFRARTEGDVLTVELTFIARIREAGEAPQVHAVCVCDQWIDGKLVSHSSAKLY